MMTTSGLLRQHLIDPEVCIRCNTCEETCPIGAITHNDDNYVVDPSICASCGDCLGPCPTGAIDSWRVVSTPYSIDNQFVWEVLPDNEEREPVWCLFVEGTEHAWTVLIAGASGEKRLSLLTSVAPEVALQEVDHSPEVATLFYVDLEEIAQIIE